MAVATCFMRAAETGNDFNPFMTIVGGLALKAHELSLS